MANMADAFMKGYGFVDSLRRQRDADARAKVEQGQHDTLFNMTLADKVQADKEGVGYHKGLADFFDAMSQELGTTPDKLHPTDQATLKSVYDDPATAAQGVEDFRSITQKLDAGQTPDGKLMNDYFNNSMGHDLATRAQDNGLSGMEIAATHPSPDGKSLLFEAKVTKPDGSTYLAPLTENKTKVGDPGSAQDPVAQYPISQVMQQGGDRAVGIMKALRVMATQGGTEGASFATKYLMTQDAAKRAALIEEYRHTRDRAEKMADTQSTQAFDLKKIGVEHSNRMSERVLPSAYEFIKDSDGNITGVGNNRTGVITAPSGAGMSSAAPQIVIDGRQVTDKKAQELFKTGLSILAEAKGDLAGLFGGAPLTTEGAAAMDPEQKQTLLAKAVELSKDQTQPIQVRTAAARVLSIGAQRGLFDNEPVAAMPGTVSSHAPSPGMASTTQGVDPAVAGILARGKQINSERSAQPQAVPPAVSPAAQQTAPSSAPPAAQQTAPSSAPPAAQPQTAPPATLAPSMSLARRAGRVIGGTGKAATGAAVAVADVAIGARDALEKVGTSVWWREHVRGLSDDSAVKLKALIDSGKVTADSFEQFTARNNKNTDQVIEELFQGIAEGAQ